MDDLVPYRFSKQLVDKSVALLLLALVAPLFLLAFLMLAIDQLLVRRDRGGFFYREPRITQGRRFELLKFRVLRKVALEQLRAGDGSYARLYERDEQNLTRAGRILKAMYADELPQLLNVLRGDMSLVGPRPWPPAMVEQQVAQGINYRNQIVAGWTGPAQVTKDSPKRRQATEFDLQYVEACRTMSGAGLLRYDLTLLGSSVATMLRGRGLKY